MDTLTNAIRYKTLLPGIAEAFEWLQQTDLQKLEPGKYSINEEKVFAIVQEYETLNEADEKMEAHKKYIDVQYMIKGEEMVGLSLLNNQSISKEYDEENDFMLFEDVPTFYASLTEDSFMIFFPTDLHMPCIQIIEPAFVKKVVVKVLVE